jgi:hypothetical protein
VPRISPASGVRGPASGVKDREQGTGNSRQLNHVVRRKSDAHFDKLGRAGRGRKTKTKATAQRSVPATTRKNAKIATENSRTEGSGGVFSATFAPPLPLRGNLLRFSILFANLAGTSLSSVNGGKASASQPLDVGSPQSVEEQEKGRARALPVLQAATMSRAGIVSRAASLLVVAVYLALAAFDKVDLGGVLIGFLAGLPLIWFSELISSTVLPPLGGGIPTKESPPVAVAFLGWVFLLAIPLVFALTSREAPPIQRPFPR